MTRFDAVAEATASFMKLFERRNWLLGAPQFAGALLAIVTIGAVFLIAFGPQFWRMFSRDRTEPTFHPWPLAIGISLEIIIILVVTAFTYGWTLTAADPVWRGGEPAFDRGFNRAAAKLGQLMAFFLLIGLLAVVSFITIVGPIVVLFLAIYGPAYIVFKDASATDAIGRSFRLASENVGETVILVLAFIVVNIGAGIVSFALIWLPLIGVLVQFAAQWLMTAYMAIALVRFFDVLSNRDSSIPIIPETSV